ncbi:MAG: tyrosine-type recombinase/integrase, partial [Gammaproteobacteria bacterium]|nr:tyrosine-type recombinase/integrase [Gammaproteobacteria bacterium]
DILTPREVEQLIAAVRKLRYRVFILTTYSMGLRLRETLSLQVRDVDAARDRVHNRFVPLPDLTYKALYTIWVRHRRSGDHQPPG